MKMEQVKLEENWLVELHPKGGSQIRQVRDVIHEHYALRLEGKQPEWISVAIRRDFEGAREELTRIRKELREKEKTTKTKSMETENE